MMIYRCYLLILFVQFSTSLESTQNFRKHHKKGHSLITSTKFQVNEQDEQPVTSLGDGSFYEIPNDHINNNIAPNVVSRRISKSQNDVVLDSSNPDVKTFQSYKKHSKYNKNKNIKIKKQKNINSKYQNLLNENKFSPRKINHGALALNDQIKLCKNYDSNLKDENSSNPLSKFSDKIPTNSDIPMTLQEIRSNVPENQGIVLLSNLNQILTTILNNISHLNPSAFHYENKKNINSKNISLTNKGKYSSGQSKNINETNEFLNRKLSEIDKFIKLIPSSSNETNNNNNNNGLQSKAMNNNKKNINASFLDVTNEINDKLVSFFTKHLIYSLLLEHPNIDESNPFLNYISNVVCDTDLSPAKNKELKNYYNKYLSNLANTDNNHDKKNYIGLNDKYISHNYAQFSDDRKDKEFPVELFETLAHQN